MATSKYLKRTRAVRRIASGAAVGDATLRLQLNRDWLITEHKVSVSVVQAYTNIPTSVDVRDFISSVAVETSDGRRVFLTGPQVYDLGRFTEDASAVSFALAGAGNNTANWAFEIHHENDAALLDMLTALRSNELTTLDLVITFAADAANGFKGGTVPLVATYTVNVESMDYEMLTEKQFGALLGSSKHYQERLGSKLGTAAGSQPDIQLITGNLTRFITLHAYNTAGAVPVLANTIIGNLRLNINGRDYRVTTGFDVQQDNTARRGFTQAGVYVIDFGDDENGWLDLRAVNQALLQWDVLAGAPAGYTVDVAQDFTRSGLQ